MSAVTIPGVIVAKQGTALNADTIHYEIEIGKGAIKNTVETDTLAPDADGNCAPLPDGATVCISYSGAEPITFTMSTKKVAPNENYVQSRKTIDKSHRADAPCSLSDNLGGTDTPAAINAKVPQTGDNLNVTSLVAPMLLSATGAGVVRRNTPKMY